MECTIAALIACFSWGNIYLDSGLSIQDRGEYLILSRETLYLDDRSNVISDSVIAAEFNDTLNPYGRLAIGYDISFRSVTWTVEVSHVSSLATDIDRGINSITLKTKWFPFR